MTGSAALSDWYGPAVIRTRSCDPDGSITTSPLTCDLSCCRATRGMPATPAMAPWPGARSHKSWFEAWARMLVRKTFELIAERGPATEDFDALFSPLHTDPPGSLDGTYDAMNMPLTDEPQRV